MFRAAVFALFALLPVRGFAEAAPYLFVAVQERDEVDRIVIRNTGDCALAAGLVVLDMRPSQGSVVIDTAVGGRGTKDAWPVRVVTGPVRLARPVPDGSQVLILDIETLVPGQSAQLTLDIDNERAWFRAGRIAIRNTDLRDSLARFTPRGGTPVTVAFGDTASVALSLPETACASGDGTPTTTPLG
ncbi:MAG: hypothetical protein GVY31_06380 [Alphaproteobacteria bacterium]|jgi:hypothetical protein|nr:hypothetical protein [Alphaproteobacteria bacterium]